LSLQAAPVAARPVRGLGARAWLGANLAVMALLLGWPLARLVERSFAVPGGHGLAFYRALSHTGRGTTRALDPWGSIRTSLAYGAAATTIAVAVGLLAALSISLGRRGRRALDAGIMLPLGTSAVTIGFGLLITMNRPPLDLRASPVIVPIGQALVATPFVVRVVLPVLRSIDPRLREAAAVLGASPRRAWRAVDLVMARRALATGAAFAFAVSLGEFGATSLLARRSTPTLPIAIADLLGRPGALNVGQAYALATILAALTALVMLVAERGPRAGASF
jgi:thiamine transport system permease protein